MILVDTSVWIDHIRRPIAQLRALLDERGLLIHSFVIGELVLGGIRRRSPFIATLTEMDHAEAASDDEVLDLIEQNAVIGIGYVDAHLLAATRLTPKSLLWTRDRSLLAVARRLSLAYEPSVH